MATLETDGIKKLVDELKSAGDDVEELAGEMLEAGAEATVREWKEGIETAGHVDTGAMRDAVKATGRKSKLERVIYPTGKDEKGVRNAEKAFVLHYGTSGKLGDRFVDKIEEEAAVTSQLAMQKVLDDYLRSKGLI